VAKKLLTVGILNVLMVYVVVMLIGCAGGISVVPLSVKIQNADRKVEAAGMIAISNDLEPKKRRELLADKRTLYDGAIALYTECAVTDKYNQRAHFRIAEIYKSPYHEVKLILSDSTNKKGLSEFPARTSDELWDLSVEHYQTAVDLAPTGYLGSRSKGSISDIRKSRNQIQESLRVYRNQLSGDDDRAKQTQDAAAQALYDIGESYMKLGNYREAIDSYEKLAAEFPDHELAPRSQFKVGNVYFYKLYDYSNKGGWGAFVKVAQNYEGSFESKQAETLLKKSAHTLTGIKQDQDDINKYTNKKAMAMRKMGRYVTPDKLYQMGFRDRIVQNYQNIAAGWQKMENFPNSVFCYKELAYNLRGNAFAVSDALYQIGRLYQLDGQLENAISGYETLFERAPQSIWRDECVYQQAVCYRGIREFELAYEGFKTYMSLAGSHSIEKLRYYREADQIVRQLEQDQDEDGFMFYQEQEDGTSDRDPDDNPDTKKESEPQA
jgi:tetratricopeptide (TPR) repeat protein